MDLFRRKYKNIYFDLDRTLWDYESNARITLNDIYDGLGFDKEISEFDLFYRTFQKHNEQLWAAYARGDIKKPVLCTKRFELTLAEFGLKNDALTEKISEDYIRQIPNHKNLLPYAYEILTYLKEKKYRLFILTNGFNETQFSKIRNSHIEGFFEKIITSDIAKSQKPNSGIFEYALNSVNAKKSESLMVGDDFNADIVGSHNFGIDQVFYNQKDQQFKPIFTYEISSLRELKGIL
ncbi:MAG: YjjG family noncanonical pyrimidine nucleotidase [Bacteroidota bacterium]|nr:YjjG family noncanonical pyrimidine nucleotidase [Bacteroidota bacterium]